MQHVSMPTVNLAMTGANIRAIRKQRGLSVKDLQDIFGFATPQAIYKWQQGKCLPTLDNLLALSRLLKVPMEDLLVYEDQEVPLVFGENLKESSASPCAGRNFFVLSYG